MRALKSQGRRESGDARLARLAELLRQALPGNLDQKVAGLLTHLPPEEVRKALVELIKRTSENEFVEIKTVYLKHFGNAFH
jgi:hypothetical protein